MDYLGYMFLIMVIIIVITTTAHELAYNTYVIDKRLGLEAFIVSVYCKPKR